MQMRLPRLCWFDAMTSIICQTVVLVVTTLRVLLRQLQRAKTDQTCQRRDGTVSTGAATAIQTCMCSACCCIVVQCSSAANNGVAASLQCSWSSMANKDPAIMNGVCTIAFPQRFTDLHDGISLAAIITREVVLCVKPVVVCGGGGVFACMMTQHCGLQSLD
jgi:hypothetical protein